MSWGGDTVGRTEVSYEDGWGHFREDQRLLYVGVETL